MVRPSLVFVRIGERGQCRPRHLGAAKRQRSGGFGWFAARYPHTRATPATSVEPVLLRRKLSGPWAGELYQNARFLAWGELCQREFGTLAVCRGTPGSYNKTHGPVATGVPNEWQPRTCPSETCQLPGTSRSLETVVDFRVSLWQGFQVQTSAYVERLVDLMDPNDNLLLNMTAAEAAEAVASGSPERIRAIDGQFAIVQKRGNLVRMARSIGRPMRYFLAKQTGWSLFDCGGADRAIAPATQNRWACGPVPSFLYAHGTGASSGGNCLGWLSRSEPGLFTFLRSAA